MTAKEKQFLKSLPPADMLRVMKLVKWILDGKEEGMELAYQDGEIIAFRFKRPFKELP